MKPYERWRVLWPLGRTADRRAPYRTDHDGHYDVDHQHNYNDDRRRRRHSVLTEVMVVLMITESVLMNVVRVLMLTVTTV